MEFGAVMGSKNKKGVFWMIKEKDRRPSLSREFSRKQTRRILRMKKHRIDHQSHVLLIKVFFCGSILMFNKTGKIRITSLFRRNLKRTSIII